MRDIEGWIATVAPADLELAAFTIGSKSVRSGADVPNPFSTEPSASAFDRAYRAGRDVGNQSLEQARWLRQERARLLELRDPLSMRAIIDRAADERALPLIQRRG